MDPSINVLRHFLLWLTENRTMRKETPQEFERFWLNKWTRENLTSNLLGLFINTIQWWAQRHVSSCWYCHSWHSNIIPRDPWFVFCWELHESMKKWILFCLRLLHYHKDIGETDQFLSNISHNIICLYVEPETKQKILELKKFVGSLRWKHKTLLEQWEDITRQLFPPNNVLKLTHFVSHTQAPPRTLMESL